MAHYIQLYRHLCLKHLKNLTNLDLPTSHQSKKLVTFSWDNESEVLDGHLLPKCREARGEMPRWLQNWLKNGYAMVQDLGNAAITMAMNIIIHGYNYVDRIMVN